MADPDFVGLPSGTVTFLLTDVEGSTKLWQRHPDAMPGVIARHYEILDAVVARHSGIRPQEQGEGDSIVAAFSRASDAVAAALDIQRSLLAEHWADDVPLRVRMALHTGEPVQRDDRNYLGMAIIRCARLRAAGHGGQILISDATASLVGRTLPAGASLVDLGRHRLKDLIAPEDVHQLTVPDLPSTFPPLNSLDRFRQNLPAQLTSLVGRIDEIAELTELMTHQRIVTLTGAGGVGKTRLSIHVAAELVDRFPGGIAWVELASLRDPERVAIAILDAVGGKEEAQRDAIEVSAASIGDDPLLVVLDNCEHLLSACASTVATLLVRCPNLSVLLSSREPVGIPGEVVWRVPSLSLPDAADPTGARHPERSDAVALFLERARLARPHLVTTPSMLEAASRICRRLDGIPLAIELAAARCRTIPPEKVSQLLDERFRLLTGGSSTVLARQQTLLASVRWSVDLLQDNEKTMLRRMSVFAGPVDIEAIESIISSLGDVDRWEAFDLIDRLVDKSLAVMDDTDPATPRYRLLETIRQFAAEESTRTGEWVALRDAHAQYWQQWLRIRSAPFPPDAVLFDIARYQDEFRAASNWVAGDRRNALALQALLAPLWFQIGRIEDFRRFAVPLVFDPDPANPDWVRLLGMATYALVLVGRADAFSMADEAKRSAVASGDLTSELALETMGVWGHPDPFSMASKLAERAERLGEVQWAANSWIVGGLLGGMDHDLDALTAATEGLAQLRLTEPAYFQSSMSILRAMTAGMAGDMPSMLALSWQALREVGGFGSAATGMLSSVVLAGLLSADADAVREALRVLGASRERTPEHEAACTFAAQAASVLDGQSVRADTLPQILSVFLPIRSATELLVRIFHEAQDDPDCSFAGLWPQNGFVRASMRHTAMQAIKAGDTSLAEETLHQLLVRSVANGSMLTQIDCLEWLALCAFRQGAGVEAARLLGAADAARDASGYRLRFRFERALLEGIDTSIPAYDEGRTLSLADAIGYTQRMRGTRKRPAFGWESLTPTERRVTDLAAAGRTNQQIATALIMGPGTVKSHLEHIYRKLGVSNRTELSVARSQALTP